MKEFQNSTLTHYVPGKDLMVLGHSIQFNVWYLPYVWNLCWCRFNSMLQYLSLIFYKEWQSVAVAMLLSHGTLMINHQSFVTTVVSLFLVRNHQSMLQRECQITALNVEMQSRKEQAVMLSSSVCTVDIDFISWNRKAMVSFSESKYPLVV